MATKFLHIVNQLRGTCKISASTTICFVSSAARSVSINKSVKKNLHPPLCIIPAQLGNFFVLGHHSAVFAEPQVKGFVANLPYISSVVFLRLSKVESKLIHLS